MMTEWNWGGFFSALDLGNLRSLHLIPTHRHSEILPPLHNQEAIFILPINLTQPQLIFHPFTQCTKMCIWPWKRRNAGKGKTIAEGETTSKVQRAKSVVADRLGDIEAPDWG